MKSQIWRLPRPAGCMITQTSMAHIQHGLIRNHTDPGYHIYLTLLRGYRYCRTTLFLLRCVFSNYMTNSPEFDVSTLMAEVREFDNLFIPSRLPNSWTFFTLQLFNFLDHPIHVYYPICKEVEQFVSFQ